MTVISSRKILARDILASKFMGRASVATLVISSALSTSTQALAQSTSIGNSASITSSAPVPKTEIEALRAELLQEKALTQKLEQRLNAVELSEQHSQTKSTATPPPALASSTGKAGFDSGFFLQDASGSNSLRVDGLLQPRFTNFAPNGTQKFGAKDRTVDNFDVFLGRLYFSGNVIDPSVSYFFTLQGTTTSNGSGITLLDAELAKTFSPYFKLEAGKYWSAYTYEYYDDIGKYLLPDLSAAEWAFSLGRQTGVRFSGKAGKLGYSLSVSNSVPGSDVGNTENLHAQLAEIVNLQYDILAPYGYQESDPNPQGAAKPELSLWASAMSNPVEYSSVFQNDLSGDRTYGATASLNFRYRFFTFQGSGYYKHNNARTDSHPGFDSYGWQEQAGYFVLPGRVEVAERVDGIHWGLGQIPTTGGSSDQWYAGPGNFSYKDLTEYTAGLNYYFSGHFLKAQLQYSYITGNGFDNRGFDANRLILQGQIAF